MYSVEMYARKRLLPLCVYSVDSCMEKIMGCSLLAGVVVCGGVHGGQEEEERTLPRIRAPLEALPDGFRQAVH
jgi:hypothetical protein